MSLHTMVPVAASRSREITAVTTRGQQPVWTDAADRRTVNRLVRSCRRERSKTFELFNSLSPGVSGIWTADDNTVTNAPAVELIH